MNETRLLDFSDVLIEPIFSNVRSRKDVDISTDFLGMKLSIPVLNSNMDTIASPELCKALANYGSIGTLHRFWSIEENVKAFTDSISNGRKPIVSIGIGDKELLRADALNKAGAEVFMLDVAHAANVAVVETYNQLKRLFPYHKFIVGDFGTGLEIKEFLKRVVHPPEAIKVGISIGSQCVTRLTTGVGTPSLSCLQDCSEELENWGDDIKLILDGGIVYLGDCAKALVGGADLIISGSLFAGTEESAGEIVHNESGIFKTYRGSASYESYVVQNKVSHWRAPEGISSLVPLKGPVINILNNISGGLKSSCSYVNAFNLDQLRVNAKFRYY